MLFNSIEFALFLPVVFCLYWFVFKETRAQNLLLLVASYLFYGWWDWRFLSLIAFSSILDFQLGKALGKEGKSKGFRKMLLWISLIVNLGFLGFFKYYDFFLESFVDAFTLFGTPLDVERLNIVLPVGISFYTFQTLSYTIDVYRRKLAPSTNIISFLSFVSFFPQLVAGPIERATNLLPQFLKKRRFDYSSATDGMRQILWGLFKKMVIADNCAVLANEIFNNYTEYSGSTLLLGAVFFAFQIYGDFSGYSDIAIGTARLFGFNLMQNFAFPYFSRDIAEFWRRWHISLSTWFRDYVYIPLGGSRGTTINKVRNVFVIFAVSGFWHGANWTFIIWGLLNAIYFLPLLLMNRNRNNLDSIPQGGLLPSIKESFQIGLTFTLTVFAWIFFRAESVTQASVIIENIFTDFFSMISLRDSYKQLSNAGYPFLVTFLIFLIIEWLGRDKQFAFEKIGQNWNSIFKYSLFYIVIILIITLGGQEQEFIYFQF